MDLLQQTIGSFKVRHHIHTGINGSMYSAIDPLTGQKVAVKVIHRHLTAADERSQVYEEHVRRVGFMDAPGVVRVLSTARLADDTLCVLSEFMLGPTLADLMHDSDEPFEVDQALDLLCELAVVLATLHENGFVHGNLKPENIFLAPQTDGSWPPQLRVADFGITHLLRPETATAEAAKASPLAGCPYYLSPEQCRGEPAGPQSDIYAMGVIAYQLLTERLPYASPRPADVLDKHIAGVLRHPSEIKPLDPAIEAAVLKALSTEAADRHETVIDFRDALDEARVAAEEAATAAEEQEAAAAAEEQEAAAAAEEQEAAAAAEEAADESSDDSGDERSGDESQDVEAAPADGADGAEAEAAGDASTPAEPSKPQSATPEPTGPKRRKPRRITPLPVTPSGTLPAIGRLQRKAQEKKKSASRPATRPAAEAVKRKTPPTPVAAPRQASAKRQVDEATPRRSLASWLLLWLVVVGGAVVGIYRVVGGYWPWQGNESSHARGLLEITTIPEGATIYLNGRKWDRPTPVRIAVQRRLTYQLMFHKRGFLGVSRKVALGADEERRFIEIKLVPKISWGTLQISTNHKANIFLDSRRVGFETTGVNLAEVRADVGHELRIVAPGFKTVRRNIRIAPGKVSALKFTLQRVDAPPSAH